MTKSNIRSDKNSQQTRKRRELPACDEGAHRRPTADVTLAGDKNAFHLRPGAGKGCALTTPVPRSRQGDRDSGRHPDCKGGAKPSSLVGDKLIHAHGSVASTRKLPELVSALDRTQHGDSHTKQLYVSILAANS